MSGKHYSHVDDIKNKTIYIHTLTLIQVICERTLKRNVFFLAHTPGFIFYEGTFFSSM